MIKHCDLYIKVAEMMARGYYTNGISEVLGIPVSEVKRIANTLDVEVVTDYDSMIDDYIDEFHYNE